MKKPLLPLFYSLFLLIPACAEISGTPAADTTQEYGGAASANYDVHIQSNATCADANCDIPATVSIYRKGQPAPFQSFEISHYNPSNDFIFGDFNFDGAEDFALRNSAFTSYGRASYSIYIYNPATNMFAENPAFSKLTQNGNGMFGVDLASHSLQFAGQVSPDKYMEDTYTIINNSPSFVTRTEKGTRKMSYGYQNYLNTYKLIGPKLTLVESQTEDKFANQRGLVLVTKKLINNHMVSTRKKLASSVIFPGQ